ncbi:MAG: hypothetical protein SGI83_06115 [Bacteroidota bacterium]|nr:hypothetical protein [Bacteroidota bacterium]
MSISYKRWQNYFLFCLGLFAGTAFCMKWMEGDFWQGGQQFTIIGLEITDPKEKVVAILAGLDRPVKMILRYHLYFDFAFMAAVYPGIAALCMMARDKSGSSLVRKLLFILAILQTLACGCDIAENIYLLRWISNPVIGDEFGLYHLVVYTKWIIALSAALIAIPFAIRKRKRAMA